MYSATTFETNFLDLVTTVVMVPIQAIAGALWLLWRCVVGAVGLLKPLALCVAIVGAFVLCVTNPLLPLGLAITVVVGWATYPRKAVL